MLLNTYNRVNTKQQKKRSDTKWFLGCLKFRYLALLCDKSPNRTRHGAVHLARKIIDQASTWLCLTRVIGPKGNTPKKPSWLVWQKLGGEYTRQVQHPHLPNISAKALWNRFHLGNLAKGIQVTFRKKSSLQLLHPWVRKHKRNVSIHKKKDKKRKGGKKKIYYNGSASSEREVNALLLAEAG